MARKLIRPTLSRKDGKAGGGKKRPKRRSRHPTQGLPLSGKPGQEDYAGLVLNDGEEVFGSIEWYDRDCIKLKREGLPNLIIMRHAIKYIYQIDSPREGDQKKSKPE